MSSEMPFVGPVGFSSDGATLYYAPCYSPAKGMPCVAKRSSDGGLTWSFMDVNANGSKVFNMASLPPNNKRCARGCAAPQSVHCPSLG